MRKVAPKPRLTCINCGAPGRIRTCDTGFRRAVLYPLSYEGVTRSELTGKGSSRPHSATRARCPYAGAQRG